jgi:hypothetical protein
MSKEHMAEQQNKQQDGQQLLAQQQRPARAAGAAAAGSSQPAVPDTNSSSSSASSSSSSSCRNSDDDTPSSSPRFRDLQQHYYELGEAFELLKDADEAIPEELIVRLQRFYIAHTYYNLRAYSAGSQPNQEHKKAAGTTTSSSSTAVLNQLYKDLQSGVAAAAAKLNSSEDVQLLSRLVVAAAMQAVGNMVELQEAAPYANRGMAVLPALCEPTRAAVVAGVSLFVCSMATPEQLGAKETKFLQEGGQAEARGLAAMSCLQAYTIIDACVREGSRDVGKAATSDGEAAEAAAADAAAAIAAAVSDGAATATIARMRTPEACVRAKYQGPASVLYPVSMVRVVCIACCAMISCLSVANTCGMSAPPQHTPVAAGRHATTSSAHDGLGAGLCFLCALAAE